MSFVSPDWDELGEEVIESGRDENPLGTYWMEGDSLAPPCQADMSIVSAILDLAKPTKDDHVFDLGCGDGRICIEASLKYGCLSTGVEIEEFLLNLFHQRVGRCKLRKMVNVIQGDLREIDLTDATIVIIYLLPDAILEIQPMLEEFLTKAGTNRKVVCNTWGPKAWKCKSKILTGTSNNTAIYLYDRYSVSKNNVTAANPNLMLNLNTNTCGNGSGRFRRRDGDSGNTVFANSSMNKGMNLGLNLNIPQLSLQLDCEGTLEDSLANFDSTYRAKTDFGEMSVAADRMRFEGATVGEGGLVKQLEMGRKLGSGACSSVVLARHTTTGQEFAIKIFSVFDRKKRVQLITELGVLCQIDCDSLIQFYGAYCDSDTGQIGVILEYMDLGSLERLLEPRYKVSERGLAGICFQILWGLAYLHSDDNVHRDIKPGNALIDSEGWCKLSDFGISTKLKSSDDYMSSSMKGSFHYMAPERLDAQDYNKSSDIWSVGILIMELYEQHHPFKQAGNGGQVEMLVELQSLDMDKYLRDHDYPGHLANFLSMTLEIDPTKRPESIVLLQSEWFKCMGIHDLDYAVEALKEWVDQAFGSGK